MKSSIVVALASILLLFACAKVSQEQTALQSAPAVMAALQSQSAPMIRSYRCENGETISATYASTDAATIQYKGQSHAMRIAVSGSGARYVGDGLEWWTKGSGVGAAGTLFHHLADGTTGEIVERCVEF